MYSVVPLKIILSQRYTLPDPCVLEVIRLVAKYLVAVVEDGVKKAVQANMAWVDTNAGLCIANAGVILPYAIGMTIGGKCSQIMHGEILAIVYPEFTHFIYPMAVEKFATLGRIFNSTLNDQPNEVSAKQQCELIDELHKQIGKL
jgi:alcohol dehydrogenase class IV